MGQGCNGSVLRSGSGQIANCNRLGVSSPPDLFRDDLPKLWKALVTLNVSPGNGMVQFSQNPNLAQPVTEIVNLINDLW